jgi:hypothetical protein
MDPSLRCPSRHRRCERGASGPSSNGGRRCPTEQPILAPVIPISVDRCQVSCPPQAKHLGAAHLDRWVRIVVADSGSSGASAVRADRRQTGSGDVGQKMRIRLSHADSVDRCQVGSGNRLGLQVGGRGFESRTLHTRFAAAFSRRCQCRQRRCERGASGPVDCCQASSVEKRSSVRGIGTEPSLKVPAAEIPPSQVATDYEPKSRGACSARSRSARHDGRLASKTPASRAVATTAA